MATTWNPSDCSAQLTLSGGNLTVTGSSGANTYNTVRSIAAATGKVYFEIRIDSGFTGTADYVLGVGFSTTSVTLSSPTDFIGIDTTSVGAWGGLSPDVFYNFSAVGAWTGTAANAVGDVISVAFDKTAGLFWARRNSGNWNNSGTANPATGTGGISVSGMTSGTIYAAITTKSDSASDSLTARFSSSSWTIGAPSGFGEIGPTAVETIVFQPNAFWFFPQTSGGTVINVSMPESMATSDTQTGVATFPRSVPESVATSDTQTGILTLPMAVSETVTATTDTQTGALSIPVSMPESVATSDTPSATQTLVGATSESIAISDTQTATGVLVAVMSESAAATDAQTAAAVMAAAIAESLAATDTQTGGLLYALTVDETAAITEAQTGLLTIVADRQEIMGISDSPSAVAAFVVAVTETFATADSQTTVLAAVGAIAETIAAADTSSLNGNTIAVTVDESAGIADASSIQVVLVGSVSEAVAIADSSNTTLVAVAQVLETAAALDIQTGDLPPPPGTDEFRVGGANTTDIVQTLNVATIYHTQKKTG